MWFVITHIPGDCYRGRFRSLMLCRSYVRARKYVILCVYAFLCLLCVSALAYVRGFMHECVRVCVVCVCVQVYLCVFASVRMCAHVYASICAQMRTYPRLFTRFHKTQKVKQNAYWSDKTKQNVQICQGILFFIAADNIGSKNKETNK